MRAALFGVALLVCASVAAEPGRWTIDYASSRIAFTAEQAEAPFDGGFKTFEADVRFDPHRAVGEPRRRTDRHIVGRNGRQRTRRHSHGQRLVRIGTVSSRALRREGIREDK
jgi:hypothetical protein